MQSTAAACQGRDCQRASVQVCLKHGAHSFQLSSAFPSSIACRKSWIIVWMRGLQVTQQFANRDKAIYSQKQLPRRLEPRSGGRGALRERPVLKQRPAILPTMTWLLKEDLISAPGPPPGRSRAPPSRPPSSPRRPRRPVHPASSPPPPRVPSPGPRGC